MTKKRELYKMKTKPDSTVEKLKAFVRQPYAWPGVYPLFAFCSDGGALCKGCAKTEYKLILAATKDNDRNSGWNVAGVDVNWEDTNLYCDHCGNKIESAYSEVDDNDD